MPGAEDINMQELFVTLGRIEGKVDAQTKAQDKAQEAMDKAQEATLASFASVDTRLRVVESAVSLLDSALSALNEEKKRRLTWPQIIGGIVGILTGLATLIGLGILLSNFLTVAATIKQ